MKVNKLEIIKRIMEMEGDTVDLNDLIETTAELPRENPKLFDGGKNPCSDVSMPPISAFSDFDTMPKSSDDLDLNYGKTPRRPAYDRSYRDYLLSNEKALNKQRRGMLISRIVSESPSRFKDCKSVYYYNNIHVICKSKRDDFNTRYALRCVELLEDLVPNFNMDDHYKPKFDAIIDFLIDCVEEFNYFGTPHILYAILRPSDVNLHRKRFEVHDNLSQIPGAAWNSAIEKLGICKETLGTLRKVLDETEPVGAILDPDYEDNYVVRLLNLTLRKLYFRRELGQGGRPVHLHKKLRPLFGGKTKVTESEFESYKQW